MIPIILLLLSSTKVYCEPETVRENFDYFSYGNSDDFLKNLDLHLVSIKLYISDIFPLVQLE